MRESPKLAIDTIKAALHEHYGISFAALTFLPIGNDSASAVYRVEALDGATYFLKARASRGFRVASLVTPHYFQNQGVPHLIAPIPTINQALWVTVNDFALSLYPYIDGRTGTDVGLSDEHWRTLGATMRQIHSCLLSPELIQIVPRETFIPNQRSLIANLETAIAQQSFGNPEARELAAFWNSRAAEIRTLTKRVDALGHHLRQAAAPFVLCHADLHTWNVLLDTDQQLWIVDWDETVLALKERDLMFVIGGIGADLVTPHSTICFLQGYGEAAIDTRALVYYRYAWAVQDLASYGEQIFFLPEFGQETRREALHGFAGLFGPGEIVKIAVSSDSAAV